MSTTEYHSYQISRGFLFIKILIQMRHLSTDGSSVVEAFCPQMPKIPSHVDVCGQIAPTTLLMGLFVLFESG